MESLKLLDRVAAETLARLAPLRLGVASKPEDLEAVFRLRYQVVIDEGWMEAAAFEGGRDCDSFDVGAVQLATWLGDELVGTSRLIFPRPDRLLPHEEAFGLAVEPPGRVVDFGRYCVKASFRDRRHRVLDGLIAQTWLEMRKRGYDLGLGAATVQMVRLLRLMGLELTVLAPGLPYWGALRYPILIDLDKSAAGVARYLSRRWGAPA